MAGRKNANSMLGGGDLFGLLLANFSHQSKTDAEFSFWLRFQPVDATHWLNRSAGVSKFNVSLGLSFSCLATA